MGEETPESCCPDPVTHQLEDLQMDFLQELGKKGTEVSDTRPCFLGTVGENWH